jgi:hypothetical protein
VDADGSVVKYQDVDGNAIGEVPIPQAVINVNMPTYFDIKPASCPNPFNPKSKGLVPFGIVGTPDLDVTQIDPMSIVLTGPLGDTLDANDPSYKWEIKDSTEPPPTDDKCYPCFEGIDDYSGDGIDDFIFYFDNDAVETILDLGSYADGDPVPVELDAALLDGTPLVGKDQFLLRKKGKPAPESVAFAMDSPYPLPSNPEVWIPYRLGAAVDVDIVIHDTSGRLIRTLRLGYRGAGAYTTKDKAAYWDGKNEAGEDISSGIYFCTIKAGDFVATRKLVMIR